jgi:RNA polymerase sigma-54 factor
MFVRDHDEAEEPPEVSTPERLDEYILSQVGPYLLAEDRPVAAYILARLDEDGLLPESPVEIAAYLRTPADRVAHVLALIQHADPPGVGARTPQQALLIQLECLDDATPGSITQLAHVIIQDHFELLGKREYPRIARRLRVPRTAVESAVRFIQRNLTPYPARAFWGEGKVPANDGGAVLRNPDIHISLFDHRITGPLMVEVFAPLSGWLRVNPEFRTALADCAEEEREKWAPTVERAALITKCVQQRNHTMRRLMEIIAAEQRDFILGCDGDLRPLTRVAIAKALGVHESTISRAVAGKSAALPNGRIVPLSKFFDRSLSVRDRVRQLVAAEIRPLTDDEIAAALAREDIHIARRTVAKYRHMLGILPANVRAQLKKQNGRPGSH